MGTRYVSRIGTGVLIAVALLGSASQAGAVALTADEVQLIISTAAASIDATTAVIAVTDREGNPLGVFRKINGSSGAADTAVGLARTAAFFANDQAPLSSRTVRFITGTHFPPGVAGTPNGGQYGIENTNRGCTLSRSYNPGQAIPPSRSLGGGIGPGIITGKADVFDSDPSSVDPGGVPIFKDGQVAGGIGVTGVSAAEAEFAAFSGSFGNGDRRFVPSFPSPGVVFIDGVALPFVNQKTRPAGSAPGSFVGDFILGPKGSPVDGVPDGYLVGPSGSAELSPEEVDGIVRRSQAQANITRAAIRLPLGSTTRMVISVSDLQGNLLAIFRMPDATVFSIDVSATKARNMVYFPSTRLDPNDLPGVPPGTAVTARTINFGAQPLYPPGIDAGGPGPFFDLFVRDTARPCTQGNDSANRGNQSGIVFFAGSAPLYRDGVLVGGLGVSGDGVEQDEVVTDAGTRGFEAPAGIRADNIFIGGVRLPYFRFNRNPTAR
jgi:uncharacterized protein GlcG (DUF336 family)